MKTVYDFTVKDRQGKDVSLSEYQDKVLLIVKKTMVACGLGLQAINCGYTVCFEKMVNLIKLLDNCDVDRAAGFRIKNLKKAQLIIIDEVGYTPISRAQANRFFTFISDTYETSSLIFTTNKEVADWAEMMGDPVLTTALLDRILQHASCFSFTGESYRLKHPHTFPAPLMDANNSADVKSKGK